MEQARSPASSIRRRAAWRSTLSGVVLVTGSVAPPTRCSIVPSRPGRSPAASRMAWARKAVVVLPLVPVMPITASSRLGWPYSASAASAIAARAPATRSWGTGTGRNRSTISAAAPRSTATSAKSWPSARKPGTQTCSAPGTVCVAS